MFLQLIQKINNNKKYFFLISGYIFSFFSTSALLVIVYFSDLNFLTADLGLASSFLLFLCHLLSINERSVLLADEDLEKINSSFIFRLQSSIALLILSSVFFYSQNILNIFIFSISILIISQWCLEIFLVKCEVKKKYNYLKYNSFALIFYICVSVALIFLGEVLIFSLFTILFNLLLLSLSLLYFKKLKLFFNFLNYYNFFIKKNILSNRLTSSFFISISNFYFRFFIYILFSKELAASVFTFFTLGSFPASIYSLILAPSLIRNKFRLSDYNILIVFCFLYFCIGGSFLYSYYLKIDLLNNVNFLISGFSMVGSIIMIYAFHKRQLMIHDKKTRTLCFQIDIFFSLSIISIIPIIYSIKSYMLLPAAFLINSIIAYLFYGFKIRVSNFKNFYIYLIFFFLPIFFILFNEDFSLLPKVYYSIDPFFNSSFLLNSLPIPLGFFIISIIFFVIIKSYVIDRYILYIFSLIVILGLTSISILKENLKYENIYILVQFAFPICAFIIGNQFAKQNRQHLKFFKSIFFIFLFIISFQFFDIFNSKDLILSSNISSFGIYKHLQYVSQTIGLIFIITITYLMQYNYLNKLQIFTLLLVVNIYLVFSTSISGLIYTTILSLFIIYILFKKFFLKKINYLYVLLSFTILFIILKIQYNYQASYLVETTYFKIINLLPLLSDRFYSLLFYSGEISNLKDFLFGKNNFNTLNPLFNTSFNYFIDFIYNLGFLTLLPLIYLIISYIQNTNKQIKEKNSEFSILLCIFVLIFLLIDTFIKSSLRELYTGSILFFFWGFSSHYIRKK